MRYGIATMTVWCICLTAGAYNDHRHTAVDSAEQVLQSGRRLTDSERADCYYILMRGLLYTDTERHDRYSREALRFSYEANGLSLRQSALYHLGVQHYGKEQYDEAERYYRWALAVTDSMSGDSRYSESDVDDNYSQLYGALGNLYNMQDKALLAIEQYQRALPIFEKHGWLESQTILHHNVAELWLSMGNNEKAKQEYLAAVKTGEASGDSLMMALPRKGLVKIFIDGGDYDEALRTIEPAYAYYHSHRDEEHEDYSEKLASMVKLCLMDGHEDLARAKAYAQEALTLDDDELMFDTHADVQAVCAMIAMRERNWPLALKHALASVHEQDDEATYGDIGGYEMLAEIYMEMGDKAKAGLYMKKVRTMMERFATHNYQSALSQMEVIYETEKKEAQIAALAHERRLYGWLLLGTAGVVLLLVAVLIYRHLANRRQKALLAARVALEAETKERRILARDLHDSLGGMLSLLRLKMEEYKQRLGVQGESDDVLPLLDATHKELRRVSHHLMPEELLKGGLVSALRDFAVSIPGARFQSVGTVSLDQERELVLYRCAYELVNNALKHADATHIDIQLMQAEREVTLTVSDDGKGMEPEVASGMGLQNIRERIEPYHGALRIATIEGTEINVSLPL